jgi:hypothetical protein
MTQLLRRGRGSLYNLLCVTARKLWRLCEDRQVGPSDDLFHIICVGILLTGA